jgi:DNA-binding MarR family transcriptional regulator/N-acetylglutamate synthase-like GNAT family acetyltransferase
MAAAAKTLHTIADDPVQAVRRFNRFYTRQIGVLQEHLLHSKFSLTEVRVLYELADRPNITAAELCQELGLDRGYLSRMLQSFDKQEWIKATPSPADRRRSFLSLTGKGKKVFAPLDKRSSEEVAAMLDRLSSSQREKLLGAMREIENILGGGTSEPPVTAHRDAATSFNPTLQPQGLKPEVISKDLRGARSAALPRQTKDDRAAAPNHESATAYILRPHRPGDMGWVVQRHGELYWKEYGYDERFEALVAEIVAEFVQNFDSDRERCWIAEKDGKRVGAIFLVKKSKTVAKLRLLLVEPTARGLGIGKRLVSECINFAREAGHKKVLLWTQSELHAARHLYEQAGFKRTEQKPHQSWGRKDLVAETWQLKL